MREKLDESRDVKQKADLALTAHLIPRGGKIRFIPFPPARLITSQFPTSLEDEASTHFATSVL